MQTFVVQSTTNKETNMLNNVTLDKMQQLKLYGMLKSWQEMANSIEHTKLSVAEAIGILIDHEHNYRHNKKLERLLKYAKLRFKNACIEDIDYQHQRKLSRDLVKQIIGCQWIHNKENIILVGPTGIGKTYLACAFANHACRLGFSARYFRLSKLLEQIQISRSDGSYTKFLASILKVAVLVIDDWGIEPLDANTRNSILEIIDDRYAIGTTIIASQLPVSNWHGYIDNDTVADAFLDRIVNKSIKIEVQGASLRK